VTTAPEGGVWSASLLGRFNPGKDPVPIVQEGWVGPRANLDVCEKSRPHRDSIPGPSSPQPVAIPTELSRPLHVKYPIFLSDLNQILTFLKQVLMKIANKGFDGNLSTYFRFDTYVRTDRNDKSNKRFFFAIMRTRRKMHYD
jgi:hypothetical protein